MSDALTPAGGEVAAVIARHEAELMRRANVIAVATSPDGAGITIYVARKVPRDELAPEDLVPADLEGIPVRVEESGPIEAQTP